MTPQSALSITGIVMLAVALELLGGLGLIMGIILLTALLIPFGVYVVSMAKAPAQGMVTTEELQQILVAIGNAIERESAKTQDVQKQLSALSKTIQTSSEAILALMNVVKPPRG